MGFAVPAGLAAAALALPLVVWYVLRSRRPRAEVASTFLWRQTDASVSAAVPWQRFRPDRTFWLVLLALLAGAVALARPTLPAEAELGAHTIVVVDASGSMLADEDGPSRLELARREVLALVQRLGPGQVLSVIEAADRARVLAAASAEPAAVRRALADLRPTHGPADLVDAFTLVGALERPGQDTVVHLLTDGELPPAAAASAPAGLRVRSVAGRRPNLAVTRLQAVPAGGGAAQAFVQVRNYAAVPVAARVSLSVDGVEVVERGVDLAPRGSQELLLPVEAPAAGAAGGGRSLLVAAVGPAADGLAEADRLAIDDRAFAVLFGPRQLQVLIAGPGNTFLEAAFAALPDAAVRTAPGVPEDLEDVDLLVVDRIPAPARPQVPTVYVAPVVPPEGVTAAAERATPALTYQDAEHELLRDVDLSGTALAAARPVEAPELRTLAAGPDGDLLLAGRLGAVPVVYLAFDLLESNLPLQVAWPVLVANTATWLAGPPAPAPLVVGAETSLPVPPGVTGLVVEPPSGAPLRLDVARPRLVLDQVGVWEVRYETSAELTSPPPPAPLAVNPDPGEGDLLRPAPAPPETGTRPAGAAAVREGRRVVGPGILALVLALLVAEWASAHGVRPLHGAARALRARRADRAAVLAATSPGAGAEG